MYCTKWRERRECKRGQKRVPIEQLESCPAGFFATKEDIEDYEWLNEEMEHVDVDKILGFILDPFTNTHGQARGIG